MDLVDKDFEFEILTAFGVGELRGVAKSTVTNGSCCATMILEWIMAIVAGSGLDYGPLSFNFAAAGNELKQLDWRRIFLCRGLVHRRLRG